MIKGIVISTGKILLFWCLWGAGVSVSVLSIVYSVGPHWFDNMGWRVALEAGGVIACLLALIVMARFIDKRSLETIGLPLSRTVRDLTLGTLLGMVIFAIPVLLLMAMGSVRVLPDYSRFSRTALGIALLFVFVNVLHQELLVRSYLFQEIWRRYSATAAVVISTAVFVALHTSAITRGVNGAVAGLNILLASILLGLAYLRSQALWLPVGIHFGWNAIQGPILGINVTGTDPGGPWHAFSFSGAALWTGGAMGLEGGLAGLVGPIFGIVFVTILFPRPKQAKAGLGEQPKVGGIRRPSALL